MKMAHLLSSRILLIGFMSGAFNIGSSNANICYDETCEYTFIIEQSRSMTYKNDNKHYNVVLNQSDLQVSANYYYIDDPPVGNIVKPEDAITADGYPRNIVTINGKFPGPTIEMIKGSKVVVKVENRIKTEPVSVHWHGIYVTGTPWMDGVPYVTQCPILPYQSFTYEFLADPPGTHWYHSHFGMQKSDGLFGMLIVHESQPSLPYFPLLVGDWFHQDSKTLLWSSPHLGGNADTFNHVSRRTYLHDGFETNSHKYDNGLINGRGRSSGMEKLPLHVFYVPKDSIVEFRAVCTSAQFGYEISVDEHAISVVSSDGHTIQSQMVDSLIIYPGESYDFQITTNQPVARYWLRAKLVAHGIGPELNQTDLPADVKAIIEYEGSSALGDPTSTQRQCTSLQPCTVINCPFAIYPLHQNTLCKNLDEIKSAGYSKRVMDEKFGLDANDDDIIEVFLNFGYPVGSSINARRFREPRAPFHIENNEEYIVSCDKETCANGCLCTHILELPPNRTVQMVLSQMTTGNSGAHSIHLHGHSFAVIKQAFYEPNLQTGKMDHINRDIECNDILCSKPKWRQGRPEVNLLNPVLKDTVIVPPRGYVIVRFRTDNPGYWMLHCHMDTHMAEGMAMIINEAPSQHPEVPGDFPTCGDWPTTVVPKAITGDTITMGFDAAIGTMFGLVLLGALLSSLPMMVYLWRQRGVSKESKSKL